MSRNIINEHYRMTKNAHGRKTVISDKLTIGQENDGLRNEKLEVTGGAYIDTLNVNSTTSGINHFDLLNIGTNTHDSIDTHIASNTNVHGVGASIVESTAGSQSKVDTHSASTTGVHGVGTSTVESTAGSQSKVDTHNAVTNAHGAVSTATADRIILRDSAGRAQVANGSVAADICTKGQLDTHNNTTSGVHGSTSTPTALRIPIADSNGKLDAWVTSIPITRLQLRMVRASGTDDGTFTSGAWQKRSLNTLVTNTISGASFDSVNSRFTLPVGTYYASIRCPALMVGVHKARLQNITDATTDILGTNELSGSGAGYAMSSSIIEGVFAVSGASKTYEIQHYCNITRTGDGFGRATSIAGVNEVYTTVYIEKIG